MKNKIWKPIFEEIISLVDKYADKGVNASFIEENSLEVRIGNPPDYVVNIFIYNHPSMGSVLRTRYLTPDGEAVVKVEEEGIPMMTIDYETPKEAEDTLLTLFYYLEIYLENIYQKWCPYRDRTFDKKIN